MRISKRPTQRNVLVFMEWYDHRIRQGIGHYARDHNWHLTVDECARIPRGWTGDGVLTVIHSRSDMARYLRQLTIPAVDMSFYRPDLPLPRVIGDHAQIGALAAEHFAERGFRHAAWFSTARSPIQALRLEGFAEGCASLGLDTPQIWIWEDAARGFRDDWKRMRLWLERLLRQAPKPIAVFTHNDYDAANVQDACRSVGIAVPDEVAMLGVDDNELICLNQPVPLSSIAHDLVRVGYESAALLDGLISGAAPPPKPILIPPTGIVLRQSTDFTAVSVPPVRAAMRFIRENFGRSFGIDEIAAAAGVSRSTLDRLFRQHLNRSTHREVLRTRLAAVKHLLLHTDISVADIARQTGFCHAQYLNNVFRAEAGLTPRKYRERHTVPPLPAQSPRLTP